MIKCFQTLCLSVCVYERNRHGDNELKRWSRKVNMIEYFVFVFSSFLPDYLEKTVTNKKNKKTQWNLLRAIKCLVLIVLMYFDKKKVKTFILHHVNINLQHLQLLMMCQPQLSAYSWPTKTHISSQASRCAFIIYLFFFQGETSASCLNMFVCLRWLKYLLPEGDEHHSHSDGATKKSKFVSFVSASESCPKALTSPTSEEYCPVIV